MKKDSSKHIVRSTDLAASFGGTQSDFLSAQVDEANQMAFLVNSMPVSWNGPVRRQLANAVRYLKPAGLEVGCEMSPVAYLQFNGGMEAAEAACEKATDWKLADEIQVIVHEGGSFLRLWWD